MANDKTEKTGSAAPDLQAAADKATEQGFYGIEVDPTPNEAYTVQGVTSGQATPETDAGAQAKATEHAAEVEAKFAGKDAKADKG